MAQPVRILEATLRDGSYSVDFQFTPADTAFIVNMLDRAGLSYIELGHGSGTFNNVAPKKFQSGTRQAASDEEYLAAARAAASRAKLGVITGPFAIDHLPTLVAHKFDFVRIGLMADSALEPQNLAMVERAKSLGLICSVNLMQTVALTPKQVAEVSQQYAKLGTDWFYVVDSAGGMLPSAVTEYVKAVHDASGLTVGLHAHHNAGLAVANCLAAIEAGATMVDATIQGMGREVGNAPTEQLLFLLQKLGHERDVQVDPVCKLGDLLRTQLEGKGNDPTYYATGTAELHSANLAGMSKLAKERGVSVRALLGGVGWSEKKIVGFGLTTFPADIVDPAIARIKPEGDSEPPAAVVDIVANEIARASGTDVAEIAASLFARARKQHFTSVLHLVPAELASIARPVPWQVDRYYGITVPVDGKLAADLRDRQPDVVVVDPAIGADAFASHPRVVVDSFVDATSEAALAVATAAAAKASAVWVVGAPAAVQDNLRKRLELTGATRSVKLAPLTDLAWAKDVRPSDAIVLAGRADASQLATLTATGANLWRPAIGAVVGARVTTALAIQAQLGAAPNGGFVGPLAVPRDGQLAVDDQECPASVIDGAGDHGQLVDRAARQRLRALRGGRGGI